MADPSGIDLTGPWTGVYFYPVHAEWNPDDSMAPTPFKAEIADVEGQVTGTTREPDLNSGPGYPDVCATIEGHREGLTLFFTKFPEGRLHTIDYVGDVAADGNSISGQWVIHGDWSGVFRMQRAGTATVQAATRETTA